MNISNVMTVALQFTAIDMGMGIAALVRNLIISLSNASKEIKRDFDDKQIDKLVCELYRLTEEEIAIVENEK